MTKIEIRAIILVSLFFGLVTLEFALEGGRRMFEGMETLQEMTTKAVSRLYAMGNYGKIMATPAGEVSREIMDAYAEEELPDFLKEKLLDIEAEEAKKIVAQVNATSERVLARNGVAECPFWEQSYDKHAHWYVNYEGGLEIQFYYNGPRC